MKIFILAFVSFFISSAFAESILNESAFTQRYANAVITKTEVVSADIKGRLEIEMTYSGGGTSTAYLDNAYMNYLSDTKELDVIIESYISALTKNSSDVKANMDKAHIVPVIKDTGYINHITELMSKNKEGEFPFFYEKLNDVLYILYAIDTPSSIKFIPKEDIANLGVEPKDLRDLSLSNLMNTVESLQIKGNPSTISMLVADGTYEASFLIYDALWSKENFPVKGDIVVYVPSRDVVIVTGSEDVVSLGTVREIVHNPDNHWPHPVFNIGFIRKEDKWVKFFE